MSNKERALWYALLLSIVKKLSTEDSLQLMGF